MGHPKKKGKNRQKQWPATVTTPRRRTISEPTMSPPPEARPDATPASVGHPSGMRQRTQSLSVERSVRFNVDNTLHIYPADPNVRLATRRSKIPRRFDGPEWSFYKAMRKQRQRSASECSHQSASSGEGEGDDTHPAPLAGPGGMLTPPTSPLRAGATAAAPGSHQSLRHGTLWWAHVCAAIVAIAVAVLAAMSISGAAPSAPLKGTDGDAVMSNGVTLAASSMCSAIRRHYATTFSLSASS